MNYRLHFSIEEDKLHSPDLAWVERTMRSTGDVKQSNLIREPDGSVAFLVDFVGPNLKALKSDTPVASQVSVGDNGDLVENTVRYNPVTKGWRLTLRLKVKDPKKAIEMRASLANGDKTLSETWSYQLPANE
jgi:glucans biosynthesis protein